MIIQLTAFCDGDEFLICKMAEHLKRAWKRKFDSKDRCVKSAQLDRLYFSDRNSLARITEFLTSINF